MGYIRAFILMLGGAFEAACSIVAVEQAEDNLALPCAWYFHEGVAEHLPPDYFDPFVNDQLQLFVNGCRGSSSHMQM